MPLHTVHITNLMLLFTSGVEVAFSTAEGAQSLGLGDSRCTGAREGGACLSECRSARLAKRMGENNSKSTHICRWQMLTIVTRSSIRGGDQRDADNKTERKKVLIFQ